MHVLTLSLKGFLVYPALGLLSCKRRELVWWATGSLKMAMAKSPEWVSIPLQYLCYALNCVLPQRYVKVVDNVAPFGNRLIANVRWCHIDVGWGPIQCNRCPYKKSPESHTCRGKGHAWGKSGVMLLQARDHQRRRASTKHRRSPGRTPKQDSVGAGPCWPLGFRSCLHGWNNKLLSF